MPADNGLTSTIFLLVAMVAVFYFLLIRPAQKKQKDQQALITSLAPGARVMTTAGVFATIRHIGTKQAIIEIAPGVEMTLLKQAIMRVVDPAEEEFEYDDTDGGVPAPDSEPVAAEDAVADDAAPAPRRDDPTDPR